MRWLHALLIAATWAAGPSTAVAQVACPDEALRIPVETRPIHFTPEQEMHLGDAVAEQAHAALSVVDDSTNEYLQRIGERILAELPPTGLTFRFRLIDAPYWNAFAAPGGRIYVTRKLVAFARNEDELAGIVAHEIGHVVARHSAARLSEVFEQTLGITTFGDRRDIHEKYKQLISSAKTVKVSSKRIEHQQYDADLVALIAAERAGYSPSALINVWDRYFETEGRVGNFFTNLFGSPSPETRRLREMLRTLPALSTTCSRPQVDTSGFAAWRQRVVDGDRTPGRASTTTPSVEAQLTPPLTGDLIHVKFSPDGRWALAQDRSTVHVLSVQPFAVRFRIDLDDARPAQFSRDGTKVFVHTSDLRVEWWDVASGARLSAFELVSRQPCSLTALSTDGRLLGCLNGSFDLELYDVESGEVVFEKDRAYSVSYTRLRDALATGDPFRVQGAGEIFQLAFSPDGRYFIIGNESGETVIDLANRAEVKLADGVRRALKRPFAFLTDDHLVAVDPAKREDSEIVEYPGGKRLRKLTLAGSVVAVTRGNHIVMRPDRQGPFGVVNLDSGEVVLISHAKSFDAFDGLYLGELRTGSLGLYQFGQSQPVATAALPQLSLQALSAFDVSPDFEWMALSVPERGGIWKVRTGERVGVVHGFSGAHLPSQREFVADFYKRRDFANGKSIDVPRTLVRIDVDTRSPTEVAALEGETWLDGPYLMGLIPRDKDAWDRNVTFEVRDPRTNAVRWARLFGDDVPAAIHADRASGRIAVLWPGGADVARRAVRDAPSLAGAIEPGNVKDAALIELLDGATGTVVGRLAAPLGKDLSGVHRVASSGDAVVVLASDNQVFVYSLKTGRRHGVAFGRMAIVSDAAGVLVVRNSRDVLDIYDLATLELRDRLRLSDTVRLARFDARGTRLLALTADQVVRVFDLAHLADAKR